jgi:hypothetical protein
MLIVSAVSKRPINLIPEPTGRSRSILATLDDAAFGAATPVEPKFISPVDPAARWTASWGGPAVYAYCTNYLIDVQHAVIVDVEPSTAVRQAEVTAAKAMIERACDRLDLWPERLIADTCQSALKFDPGSASNLDPLSALGQGCPGSEQEGPARSGATAASPA